MIIKDENGKVTAVTVHYRGVDVHITKDMLAGKNDNICQEAMAEVLMLAQLDPETRQAVDEMTQSITERWQ